MNGKNTTILFFFFFSPNLRLANKVASIACVFIYVSPLISNMKCSKEYLVLYLDPAGNPWSPQPEVSWTLPSWAQLHSSHPDLTPGNFTADSLAQQENCLLLDLRFKFENSIVLGVGFFIFIFFMGDLLILDFISVYSFLELGYSGGKKNPLLTDIANDQYYSFIMLCDDDYVYMEINN